MMCSTDFASDGTIYFTGEDPKDELLRQPAVGNRRHLHGADPSPVPVLPRALRPSGLLIYPQTVSTFMALHNFF